MYTMELVNIIRFYTFFFYIHSYITKKIMLHDIERDVSTMENTILKENEFECF